MSYAGDVSQIFTCKASDRGGRGLRALCRLPARREDVTSLAYLVDNHSCGARSGWWEGCGERTQKPN